MVWVFYLRLRWPVASVVVGIFRPTATATPWAIEHSNPVVDFVPVALFAAFWAVEFIHGGLGSVEMGPLSGPRLVQTPRTCLSNGRANSVISMSTSAASAEILSGWAVPYLGHPSRKWQ